LSVEKYNTLHQLTEAILQTLFMAEQVSKEFYKFSFSAFLPCEPAEGKLCLASSLSLKAKELKFWIQTIN